jgi:hypothetical protein
MRHLISHDESDKSCAQFLSQSAMECPLLTVSRVGEKTQMEMTKPHSVAVMLQRDMAARRARKAW